MSGERRKGVPTAAPVGRRARGDGEDPDRLIAAVMKQARLRRIKGALDAVGLAPGVRSPFQRARTLIAYLEAAAELFEALPDDHPTALGFAAEVTRIWDHVQGHPREGRIVDVLSHLDAVASSSWYARSASAELGAAVRDRLLRTGFMSPAFSDEQIGEVVLLWRRRRGSRSAVGDKWSAAAQLAAEASCNPWSREAVKAAWMRAQRRRRSR